MSVQLVKFNFYAKHLTSQTSIRALPKLCSSKFFYAHNGLNTIKENISDVPKCVVETKPVSSGKISEDWGEIISRWYKQYQNFVGISEILDAQERVTQITNQLIEVQSHRRHLQREVEIINQQLLSTHQRITKAELYSEDHYQLFENARVLNSKLKNLQENFAKKEEEERDLFTHLSSAIKFCHEKERTQSENAKYWSILLSIVSAALASLITSVNNWVRIKEIKEHATFLHNEAVIKTDEIIKRLPVLTTSLKSESGDYELIDSTLKQLIPKLSETIQEEFKKLNDYDSKLMLEDSEPVLHENIQEVSYIKIVSSMVLGAAVGTIVTALILGNFTGGG